MKTADEYVASLAAMKHNVWMNGAKVERPWEHPQIVPGINIVRLTYEWPQRPEHQDLTTATSHLTGETINRFTHIHQSTEDLRKKVEMTRLYCRETLLHPALHGRGCPQCAVDHHPPVGRSCSAPTTTSGCWHTSATSRRTTWWATRR